MVRMLALAPVGGNGLAPGGDGPDPAPAPIGEII